MRSIFAPAILRLVYRLDIVMISDVSLMRNRIPKSFGAAILVCTWAIMWAIPSAMAGHGVSRSGFLSTPLRLEIDAPSPGQFSTLEIIAGRYLLADCNWPVMTGIFFPVRRSGAILVFRFLTSGESALTERDCESDKQEWTFQKYGETAIVPVTPGQKVVVYYPRGFIVKYKIIDRAPRSSPP